MHARTIKKRQQIEVHQQKNNDAWRVHMNITVNEVCMCKTSDTHKSYSKRWLVGYRS
jgi:hypothetical protein